MNIPLELISRVLARRTAEPHSISRLARNENRGAQRRSDRRANWSQLPIDPVNAPAKDPKVRRQRHLAAKSAKAYACYEHTHTTPETDILFPAVYLAFTHSLGSELEPLD